MKDEGKIVISINNTSILVSIIFKKYILRELFSYLSQKVTKYLKIFQYNLSIKNTKIFQ